MIEQQYGELQLPLALHCHLEKLLSCYTIPVQATRLVINYKALDYYQTKQGLHPVEIAINQQSSGEWNIEYITEFAYFGSYYPELERSMDFDISNNCWFTSYSGWLSLKTHQQDAKELYQLWEGNFLTYVDMDAYDQIKVSC
ncbi:DUF2787 domain-containing protein [Photobacterium toruni]|uniref:DUF2787 domain-containing protein n=1 Tax=Photobacterium toruni TaxID=1935446 RepID=UPI00210FA001|nr:DUF2787 domain-containing protein [Photobacterium toruni]